MTLNQPFLSLDTLNKNCLLCDTSIANGAKQTNFTDKGWPSLKEQALLWLKIHIPLELPKFSRKLNIQTAPSGLLMLHVLRLKRLLTDTA